MSHTSKRVPVGASCMRGDVCIVSVARTSRFRYTKGMRRALIIAVLVVSRLLAGGFASAQTVEPVPEQVPAVTVGETSAEPKRPPTILDAVRRARTTLAERLKEREAARKEPRTVTSMAVPADVTLALWNRATDAITLVEAAKSGTTLVVNTPGAPSIKVVYNATIYSQYEADPASGSVVLGLIYPVREKLKRNLYVERETVYMPYSSEFYVPEMLSAGSDYLSYLIQEAFDELKKKEIRSRAFPDRLLTEVIDPYLVKSIVVIEHSDHKSLLSGSDPERTVGRFLVKLATNEDAAFGLAMSHAGASGLAQFIPSTYALLVRTRPDLGLIPDFGRGMADHKNAIIAQAALLDMNLADMPAQIRALHVQDRTKTGEFLAAAYNGGSTRVKRAWTTFGDKWSESTADRRLRRSALRNETVWYVAKLRKTYGMFSAGYFATPNAPSGALPVAAKPAAPSGPTPVATVQPGDMICFGDGGCARIQ